MIGRAAMQHPEAPAGADSATTGRDGCELAALELKTAEAALMDSGCMTSSSPEGHPAWVRWQDAMYQSCAKRRHHERTYDVRVEIVIDADAVLPSIAEVDQSLAREAKRARARWHEARSRIRQQYPAEWPPAERVAGPPCRRRVAARARRPRAQATRSSSRSGDSGDDPPPQPRQCSRLAPPSRAVLVFGARPTGDMEAGR